ncbi:MAG: imidazoleglycerol-phosphate dehydratase HisB [Lachnospiraceae bacterium]|nr:imidazoleglycerol-phosphate dehydratase HisB [Lachnospiraceae bacterium]
MRKAEIVRTTKETDIRAELVLDGSGKSSIDTGIGFFDHMLTSFSKHGFFDLKLSAKGDLKVDGHHTVEDCGIVLGQAFKEAVGDKAGMRRYGSFTLPMDDALVLCAVDFCGRPYFVYDLDVREERCGEFECVLAREFFYAFSWSAGINLHIRKLGGENGHHILEAAFKAFGRAVDQATQLDPRVEGVLSTKGALEG